MEDAYLVEFTNKCGSIRLYLHVSGCSFQFLAQLHASPAATVARIVRRHNTYCAMP
jgi:hypothetical protein